MSITAFENLSRFRMIGDGKFVASCPTSAHADGDRHPGLTGKVAGSKILLRCQAGCATQDILREMGLDWKALFLDTQQPLTAEATWKQRAADGFREWREKTMVEAAEELRRRDTVRRAADAAFTADLITDVQLWNILSPVFDGYAELEHEFEVLRTGDDAEALEIYRNAR